jgi:TctA family transporter
VNSFISFLGLDSSGEYGFLIHALLDLVPQLYHTKPRVHGSVYIFCPAGKTVHKVIRKQSIILQSRMLDLSHSNLTATIVILCVFGTTAEGLRVVKGQGMMRGRSLPQQHALSEVLP